LKDFKAIRHAQMAPTNEENDYYERISRIVTNGPPLVSFAVIRAIRFYFQSNIHTISKSHHLY